MRDFLANIKSTCDHLAMLGHRIDERSHISHILSGLTAEYEPIIALVNSPVAKFDLQTVSMMLFDAESRQKAFLTQSATHAHLTTIDHSSINTYGDDGVDMVFYTQGSGRGGSFYPPAQSFHGGCGRGRVAHTPRPMCQFVFDQDIWPIVVIMGLITPMLICLVLSVLINVCTIPLLLHI